MGNGEVASARGRGEASGDAQGLARGHQGLRRAVREWGRRGGSHHAAARGAGSAGRCARRRPCGAAQQAARGARDEGPGQQGAARRGHDGSRRRGRQHAVRARCAAAAPAGRRARRRAELGTAATTRQRGATRRGLRCGGHDVRRRPGRSPRAGPARDALARRHGCGVASGARARAGHGGSAVASRAMVQLSDARCCQQAHAEGLGQPAHNDELGTLTCGSVASTCDELVTSRGGDNYYYSTIQQSC